MTRLLFAPAVGRDVWGHLTVVALGDDGQLWLIQQMPSISGWSGWHSLGSPFGATLGGPPIVDTNQDGRLEVFVASMDGALWHTWQTATLPSGWVEQLAKPWYSLGGQVRRATTGVGRNKDGRLEVFAVGTDGALWHVWQVSAGGGWSPWHSLGGAGTSRVAVGLNTGGPLKDCLEVFVVGNDWPVHHMYHLWQLNPGGGWSGWTSLGGWIDEADPSLTQNRDGRLEVFGVGHNLFSGQDLTHSWQPSAGNTSWSGFSSLGNPPPGSYIVPKASRNQDGRLEVFGWHPNNHRIWHIWQTAPNDGWSGWGTLGRPGFGTNVELDIGNNADGRLEVFAIGDDGVLWHIWQTSPNDNWSGWELLGQPGMSVPLMGTSQVVHP